MEHLDSKGRQLHRCHHCATPECSVHGKRAIIGGERQVMEGGCAEYTFLDPMLRPNRWAGKRRIKELTTICISEENIDFVKTFILPTNKKKYQGYLNRGIEACIIGYFDDYGMSPKVGKIVRGSASPLVHKKMSFSPECVKKMNDAVANLENTEYKTSRSNLVNFILTETREAVMKMMEG